MWDTLVSVAGWVKANEQSIAIWLEGIALVAIFFLELKEYKRQGRDKKEQHEEWAKQMAIMQSQADALVNSERAWVIAELVPVCVKFSDGFWRRPVGEGWATLSEEEVLRGYYLRHRLKFTNMGRTPAHVFRYCIGYSREFDKTGTDLRLIDAVKPREVVFERLLGANDSIEVEEVDVAEYVRDSIKAIGDSEATGILTGWVEHQHVFSDTDIVTVPFAYLYKPSMQRLERIPMRKTPKPKQEQSLN